jgi:copper transport protein
VSGYAVALAASRVLGYAGFVLSAGVLSFLGLVWPQGRRHRRLVRLILAGIVMLALGTIVEPLVRASAHDVSVGDVVTGTDGAATLVRLAVVAALATYLPDLVARDLHRWRLAVTLVAVLAIEASMVAQSDAIRPRWPAVTVVAAMGHLTATAIWLGGIAALAALLLRGDPLGELRWILPSFVRIAPACAAALLVTGVPHALAVAGGISHLIGTKYGTALVLKVLLVTAMLAFGGRIRRYLNGAPPTDLHAVNVVIAAEVGLAAAVLCATAFQVWVAPR